MQTSHITDRYQTNRPQVIIHETEAPNFEARLAINLVERWGMVSGTPDGEDTSGRAKLRLMTPAEVVERAITASELLASALREKKWMTPVPAWEEAQQLAKNQRQIETDEEDADHIKRVADRATRSTK